MSIKQSLCLNFDLEVFNTDEVNEAQQAASESGGVLYCWKTSGTSNWLEKGLSLSDVLGVVVLPQGLPNQIDMPDDEESTE
ncbi:MAG: hypothetical protein M3430_09750 [Acidobacteriota bacterium]|nr:hypothetical protein [Acidobacteriota bacterium]